MPSRWQHESRYAHVDAHPTTAGNGTARVCEPGRGKAERAERHEQRAPEVVRYDVQSHAARIERLIRLAHDLCMRQPDAISLASIRAASRSKSPAAGDRARAVTRVTLMPSRMIREGILDSDRYWSVTIEARQLFWHLMLLADDLGCVSLAPAFIRRRCFDDGPSQEKIDRLIDQLMDVDLLRIYEANGARYAFIPRFQQRLKRMTLKHPEPPESILHGDDDARRKFSQIKHKTENPAARVPPDGSPPAPEEEVEVEVEVKPAPQAARDAIWSHGLQLVMDTGISEPNARKFIGMLCAEWDDAYVIEALRAAVGKADAKSYARKLLASRPKKGQSEQKRMVI